MTAPGEHPPRWAYSRGAELLMRVATSAMAGVVVSLGWIAAGPASDETTALCAIIGLSAIMAVTIFWGVARTEANKSRALMDIKLEMQTQALRAEIRANRDEIRALTARQPQQPQRRRPSRQRRRSETAPAGGFNVLKLPAPETRWAIDSLQRKINGDSDGDSEGTENG